MKIFPTIIQHGSDESFQSIILPRNDKKSSISSYDTQMSPNHQTNATFQTPPIKDQSKCQIYHFQREIKECRICLENSQQNEKQLVKLCKCMGSVEFVHEQCYRSWVQKSLQIKSKQQKNKILRKKRIQCEMCRHNINVKFEQDWELGKCEKTQKNIRSKPKMFTFISILFISTLASLIYLTVRLSIQGVHLERSNDQFFDSLISVCGIVLLIVLNSISGFFIVEQFFITSRLRVKLVLSSQQQNDMGVGKLAKQKNKNNQIIGPTETNPESPLHISPQQFRNRRLSGEELSGSPHKLQNKRVNRRNSRYQRSVAERVTIVSRNDRYQESSIQGVEQISNNMNNRSLSLSQIEQNFRNKIGASMQRKFSDSNYLHRNSRQSMQLINLQQILVSDQLEEIAQ